MTFINRNSIVVHPVTALTREGLDCIFSAYGEIVHMYLEIVSGGELVCWICFVNRIAANKAIEEINGKIIAGNKVTVESTNNYIQKKTGNAKSDSDYDYDSSDKPVLSDYSDGEKEQRLLKEIFKNNVPESLQTQKSKIRDERKISIDDDDESSDNSSDSSSHRHHKRRHRHHTHHHHKHHHHHRH